MIKVMNKAPLFQLKDQHNSDFNLHSLQGKRILIYFFPDITSLNCQVHASMYARNMQRFQEHNVVVIGISGNQISELKEQSERLFLNFILLSDEKRFVQEQYGVWEKKITFGKERWITKRCALLIDEQGVIIKVYKRATIEHNVFEVLAYLDHIQHKAYWKTLSRRQKEKIRKADKRKD